MDSPISAPFPVAQRFPFEAFTLPRDTVRQSPSTSPLWNLHLEQNETEKAEGLGPQRASTLPEETLSPEDHSCLACFLGPEVAQIPTYFQAWLFKHQFCKNLIPL